MRVSLALALSIVVSTAGQFSPVTVIAQTAFVFTTIDVPGVSGRTYATGINNAGQIVGWFHDATGDHGFLRIDEHNFITFDAPQAVGGTSLQGINDSGYSTGSFFNSTTNGRSFLVSSNASGFVNFDFPDAPGPTYAHDINNFGQIVGHFFSADSSSDGPNVHGFLRNANGSFSRFDVPGAPVGTLGTIGTIVRGINDVGQIVGYVLGLNGSAGEIGFIGTTDGSAYTRFVAPHSVGTTPTDVNNNGEIVGSFGNTVSPRNSSFVRHSDGRFTVFGHPNTTSSHAQGINDLGQVVGYFSDSTGDHGFLATPISDERPPGISGMPSGGCSLWPPNKKMIQVATVIAADHQSGVVPGSFQVTGTSNQQSHTSQILITPNDSGGYVIQLEADRTRNQNRIYTLTATASDVAGNTSTETATCTVTHK